MTSFVWRIGRLGWTYDANPQLVGWRRVFLKLWWMGAAP